MPDRRRPGEVRDAIRDYLRRVKREASVGEIQAAVTERLGDVPASSVRSSLRLSDLFSRTARGRYRLSGRG
jgi:Arc/MetJ-type ribon-helix-helix transcriptional regulator